MEGDEELEIISEKSARGDDKPAIVECPKGYSVTSCNCADGYSAGSECDGVEIIKGKCIAYSAKDFVKVGTIRLLIF